MAAFQVDPPIPPVTGIAPSSINIAHAPFVAFANRSYNKIGEFADSTVNQIADISPVNPDSKPKKHFGSIVLLFLAIAGIYFIVFKK